MAIDLMVMPLSRYWSGDYVTPAMRQCWDQGLPYAIVRPHEGIHNLPPGVPFGGTRAPDERRRLLSVVGDLQRQVGGRWKDDSDANPTFVRVDPGSFEALLSDAERRVDYVPGFFGQLLLRRKPRASHLAHGTIFLPVRTTLMSGDGFVIASQAEMSAELNQHTWPDAARDAVQCVRHALDDARRLRLPLIVDM